MRGALLATAAVAVLAVAGCQDGGKPSAGASPSSDAPSTKVHPPKGAPPVLVSPSRRAKPPAGKPTRVGPLVLRLRSGWKVMRAGGAYLVATAPCAKPAPTCRGFWVLGSAAIKHGYRGRGYTTKHPYYPSKRYQRCPGDGKLFEKPPRKPKSAGYWPVGSRKAVFHQWSMSCVTAHKKRKSVFSQWEWYLPASHVLIVDYWDNATLGTVLRWARWG